MWWMFVENRWMAAQSVFYHLYNQVSYMSLDEISPLTFSIGNTMKRISVIVSSIIIFRTPVQPVNALGAAIAILGTFLYSQVIISFFAFLYQMWLIVRAWYIFLKSIAFSNWTASKLVFSVTIVIINTGMRDSYFSFLHTTTSLGSFSSSLYVFICTPSDSELRHIWLEPSFPPNLRGDTFDRVITPMPASSS